MEHADAAEQIATAGTIVRVVEPPSSQTAPGEHGCLNCGSPLESRYCRHCGQAAHVHRTIMSLFHDLLHGVLHLEGKTWRTLPMLAWRPGELTRRYIAGERARYVSPLTLFLFTAFLMLAVVNVELLAFIPNFDSYGLLRFKPGRTEADKIEYLGGGGTDAVPPGAVQPAKLALPALIEAVDARAASAAAKDHFAGAILLAKNGRVLFQKAYGLADRARRKPNRVDTQFRFGSMGKMFTAVAIMQLVEKGRIDPQAPIGRYLTDYPNQDIATKVTVANLLSHTGGTGNIFGPDYDRRKASLRSTKDYVDLYGSRAPEFAPGSRQEYSNYGFILLGRIVEQISGLRYDDYIQRNIFKPIGMTSTGNRPNSEVLPRRAVGYTGSGTRLKSADYWLPPNGTAAGGGYSTVGDFNRFVGGLTSRRLLRAKTLQNLIEGGVKIAHGQFASFDFGGTEKDAGRFIGHTGGAPGMNGSLQHFLKSGVTVVVLANRDFPAAESIAVFAAHRLPAN